MTEQAKVPAIRFAGFTDPWEQRKLGEFSKKNTIKNANGALSETFTNSAEQGVISQLDYFDHDITNDANISGYYVVQPDDFVYNPRISTTAPCGPINRNRLNRAGVMSPLYTVFSVDASMDKTYLEHYFKTSRWHDFMFLEGNTGARSDRFSISDATFFEMPIWCPEISEQMAIAKQLETTDTLITLHQRKYDKLVVFKKSMLEKMFPKDGESVPEIRFAGFTDPWEQRKASEVFQIVDDRGHPTLPVLSATQNQGMIYRDDSGRYIGHDESNEIGYKRVLPGDFVVHLRSFQGGFAHSQYEGITSPAYTVFRAKEPTSHSDRFWKHWFMSEHFIAGLSTVTYGIRDGRSISVDEFMNTFSAFPAVEEQAAISRLLDYLDDLITLHQRKLELLQNIKKSLLDKMFV